ncbi:MAG: hypothetical protein NTW05_02085 [Pseudonocardiales bacterium]|nr:hypothetical protein [Pseudonocardiales bacterium]
MAAAVEALPHVARLDGGPFGTVASLLPGRRRILGVRLDTRPGGGTAEIAVVARLGLPLPLLAEQVVAAVRAVLGPVTVDLTFSDVVPAVTAVPPAPPRTP